MEQQSSEKLPVDGRASEYVVVEGFMMTTKSKPPQQQRRRPEYFPFIFDVLFLHPSPNHKSSIYNLTRYKTQYEFWVNYDDFSAPESGVAAVNGFVDLMSVPFPLRDVQLFWKTFRFEGNENKSECEIPVADWDSMVVILFRFLRDVKDFVRKQGDENCYPFVKLRISKFVKLTREDFEVAWRTRKLEEANGGGAWSHDSLRRPHQTEMEWRMAVLLAEGIERVKLGGGEKEFCGICLTDMSVGSEVARLPCCHLAHERCILNWLSINNSCPFCRFKISAIEGKTRPTPDNYWLN